MALFTSLQTHNLICKYNRRDLTVWGNFSKEVTDKCFKKVTVEARYSQNPLFCDSKNENYYGKG